MKRTMLSAVGVSGLLLVPGGADAARGHHPLPAMGEPGPHVLVADVQAQVYAAHEPRGDKAWTIRACFYGQRRSSFLSDCNNGEGARQCLNGAHVTLVGTTVAYEVASIANGRDESGIRTNDFQVWVLDLRTGHLLHDVPTGTPLRPQSGEVRYVGVGRVVALVLRGDGSVAWIAEDDLRSSTREGSPEVLYFDVYAVDRAGTRLLASGSNVDPSSLGLSVGGTGVGSNVRTIVGSTLYWTQGGSSFSTTLN